MLYLDEYEDILLKLNQYLINYMLIRANSEMEEIGKFRFLTRVFNR